MYSYGLYIIIIIIIYHGIMYKVMAYVVMAHRLLAYASAHPQQCGLVSYVSTRAIGLYRYGLYSCGMYSHGLYSYGLYRYGLFLRVSARAAGLWVANMQLWST